MSWSYGSWIYNYLSPQCPLKLWVRIPHVVYLIQHYLVRNAMISHEWGKDREVFTISGAYPWSFVTQILNSSSLKLPWKECFLDSSVPQLCLLCWSEIQDVQHAQRDLARNHSGPMSEKWKKKSVLTPRNVREKSNTVIYYKTPTKHWHWRLNAAK